MYCCPLCRTRKNEKFYDSPWIAQPICETCFIQLDHLFSRDDNRPEACIVDRVEQFTGLTWNECLVIVLRENPEYWQNVERDPDAFRDKFEILSEQTIYREFPALIYGLSRRQLEAYYLASKPEIHAMYV